MASAPVLERSSRRISGSACSWASASSLTHPCSSTVSASRQPSSAQHVRPASGSPIESISSAAWALRANTRPSRSSTSIAYGNALKASDSKETLAPADSDTNTARERGVALPRCRYD
jgi:hypothetical protein